MSINNNLSLFSNKLIQNVSKYSLEELKCIITNFKKNNNEIILNNIDEEMDRKKLECIILDIWKNNPIYNDSNEIIDCPICLNHVINSNYLILEQCNHILHSSCFFNYLFTNINEAKNINETKNKIKNTFKCPKCRKYITEQIETKYKNNSNENSDTEDEVIIDNEYDNNNILSDYNLIYNTIDIFNDNILHDYMTTMIPYFHQNIYNDDNLSQSNITIINSSSTVSSDSEFDDNLSDDE